MVYNLEWSQGASCIDENPLMFFDYYEDNASIRHTTDALCNACPIQQTCFGWGAAKKETGVWGGIYMVDGKIDDELNQHKTEQDWRNLWLRLTTLMK